MVNIGSSRDKTFLYGFLAALAFGLTLFLSLLLFGRFRVETLLVQRELVEQQKELQEILRQSSS